jgi:trans-aconitate 2-methyltransferase
VPRSTSARAWFEYDSLVERAVPRYRELLQRLVHYVPPGATDILELGCGTGNLSLEIAATRPRGWLVLLDGATEMTALAPRRVHARKPDCV